MRLADALTKDIAELSKQTAVTFTETCGGCDWVVRGSGGNKLACGHPRIMHKRPYVSSGNPDDLTRAVTADFMPEWCPLYES
jgi:hypothetical protein